MQPEARTADLGALVLIGRLQDKEVIRGPWSAKTERALEDLMEREDRGTPEEWVSHALGLLGWKGDLPNGHRAGGIENLEDELTVTQLLQQEADELALEL